MMRGMQLLLSTLALAGALAASPAAAQETQITPQDARAVASGQSGAGEHQSNTIDIMHHIGNAHEIELPGGGVWHLPRIAPIHLGALTVDISPTKHTVFMMLAALIVATIFVTASAAVRRAQAQGRPAKGFAGAMEAMSLYIRQEVVLPNVGPHGEGFAPFLLTLFYFILAMNLLGLLPWGATATGNVAVTGALALIAFVVIEVAGMKALGFSGYMHTIFYLPPGLPGPMKPIMLAIMTPVEIIGKLAKPFALAIRLFANMTAGHVLVLALIGLTFLFQSYVVGIGSAILATAIMVLEVFVAFLQAFVFTLLTSVFIGLMRAEH